MHLTNYKKIIIALLLLAFTSQTLATAAMTCQLEKATRTVAVAMDMSSDDHMNMDHTDSAMAHMHHDMSAMSADSDNSKQNHSTSDCCKTLGHCLLGGCSLAAASQGVDFLLSKLNSAVEDFYSDVAPTPLASSLYRPPIFC